MAKKINPCLKKLFVFFNMLFAIAGAVLITLAMLAQHQLNGDQAEIEGRTTGLMILYVAGGITMVIALLGVYGAYFEKTIPLAVFLCAMCVGCMCLLRLAVPFAVVRPEMEGILEQKFRALGPLDKMTPDSKMVAEKVQISLKCCGLFSYTDWGLQGPPESCSCQPEVEEEGVCQNINYPVLMVFRSQRVSKDIYSRPCVPIILDYLSTLLDVTLGFLFGFASLALVGAAMSAVMLLQLRHKRERRAMVYSVPAYSAQPPKYTFSAQPPKYTELYNPTEK